MDYHIIIFWSIGSICVSTLILYFRGGHRRLNGWTTQLLLILALDLVGYFARLPRLIDVTAGLWVLFMLVPGLISRFYFRFFMQQRYAAASRVARVISWLHPMDGWREQPRLMHALEFARCGKLDDALAIYQPFENLKTPAARSAMCNLYRLTGRWDEFLGWYERHRQDLDEKSSFLPILLRAKGETGDISGLIKLYDQQQAKIAKLLPVSAHDHCRLILFAFCGRRAAAEKLFVGSLALLPASSRDFWLATADLAAGNTSAAREQLEKLLLTADPPLRIAIERRLAHISSAPPVLDDDAQRILGEAERELEHEETYGATRSFFSKKALATQILVAANLIMFGVEMFAGGSTNSHTLYRLGAAHAPSIFYGQWWRLIASLFLHWGPLHIAMNMFALFIVGPFVEYALGFRRYLLVYLLAGIGSMDIVILLSHGENAQQLTAGASGCIMGLIGATGALMLRGWRQDQALIARRRLLTVLSIVVMQTVFDITTPQISMTGHISGLLIGFAVTLILRHRLTPPKPAITDTGKL